VTFAELTEIAATVVGATQRRLPPEIRPLARDVPVHYEATPAADVLAEGFEPDILGLFTGTAHGEEYSQDNPTPAQILLYLENLWDFAGESAEDFREEVRLTYLHELGHYFGWDEDDLAQRGLDSGERSGSKTRPSSFTENTKSFRSPRAVRNFANRPLSGLAGTHSALSMVDTPCIVAVT
jgi:predicted Zn-dependent protease with MMP-like domain